MVIGVYSHLLSKVFRFHYHSQKVIGSLGGCLGYQEDLVDLFLRPTFFWGDIFLFEKGGLNCPVAGGSGAGGR